MLRSWYGRYRQQSNSAERIQWTDFNMDSNNGIGVVDFGRLFQVINAANAAESGGKKRAFGPLKAEGSIRNRLKQNLFRAFSYFHLGTSIWDLPYLNFAVNGSTALKKLSSKSTEAEEIYAGINRWSGICEAVAFQGKQKNDVRSRPQLLGTALLILAVSLFDQGNYSKSLRWGPKICDRQQRSVWVTTGSGF